MRYIISDAAKQMDVEPHVLRYWEEELEVEIPRNEMGHRYYREEDIKLMQGVKFLKEKGFQLKSIRLLLPELDKITGLDNRRLLELRDRLELVMNQEELRQQREAELKENTDNVVQFAEVRENALQTAGQNTTQTGVQGGHDNRIQAGAQNVPQALVVKDDDAINLEGTTEQGAKLIQFKVLMNEIVRDAVAESNRTLTEDLTHSISREMEYQLKRKEMLEEERYKKLDRTLREYQQGQKQIAVTKEAGKKRESKFFKKHKVRI